MGIASNIRGQVFAPVISSILLCFGGVRARGGCPV